MIALTLKKAVTAVVLSSVVLVGSLANAHKEEVPSLEFASMQSFEVDVFQNGIDLESPVDSIEITTYTNKQLRKSNDLTFNSPADGVIHMRCMGVDCYAIKYDITQGQNGPVVYSGTQVTGKMGVPCYKPIFTGLPCLKKKQQKVGKEIVEKIAKAHKKAKAYYSQQAANTRVDAVETKLVETSVDAVVDTNTTATVDVQ